MRLANVVLPDGTVCAAEVEGHHAWPLAAPDITEVLRHDIGHVPRAAATHVPVSRLRYLPTVSSGKVVCVGLNYRAHIVEMGRDVPTHPTLFAKFPDALIGAHDDLELHDAATGWDYEVELGVVVGSTVPRQASREQAVAAIAGYTVVNDITARDWQGRTLQWLQGKSWDRSTPVGPHLVTPDELPGGPGAPHLDVECRVNGELRQRANTRDLVFDPATLVAYVSNFLTLHAGDLIATGTPGGVGAGRQPPTFLSPGDTVECHIAGIGACVNRCVPTDTTTGRDRNEPWASTR